MPAKLSDEQKHERIYCALAHWPIALCFAISCEMQILVTWKTLDKPIALRTNTFEVSFYALIVVVFIPISMTVFRCFSERFVIGVGALVLAKGVLAWFAPTVFAPSVFNPLSGLVERAFLILWSLSLLMSLNMLVQAFRNPSYR